jgi:hypothetical protein
MQACGAQTIGYAVRGHHGEGSLFSIRRQSVKKQASLLLVAVI